MEEIFARIYAQHGWGSLETPSGSGSTISNTGAIRAELPFVVREFGIQSVLDIPCGDFHWMKEIALDEYIGADIVGTLVDANVRKYGTPTTRFCRLDITQDELPEVDLVFCRDCLVHFSFDDISRALHIIKKSKSCYLMTTTFTSVEMNQEIQTGDWRPLNLQKAPLNFPEPIRLMKENRIWDGSEWSDKSLGLWRIEDLPD